MAGRYLYGRPAVFATSGGAYLRVRAVGGREPEARLDVSEGGLVVSPNWFQVKEGEASIFKPAGGGKYAPIVRVPTDQGPTAKK
jgi:hypothetical protein